MGDRPENIDTTDTIARLHAWDYFHYPNGRKCALVAVETVAVETGTEAGPVQELHEMYQDWHAVFTDETIAHYEYVSGPVLTAMSFMGGQKNILEDTDLVRRYGCST